MTDAAEKPAPAPLRLLDPGAERKREALRVLDDARAKVESGEYVAVCVIGETADRGLLVTWSNGPDSYRRLGMIDALKAVLLHDLMRGT